MVLVVLFGNLKKGEGKMGKRREQEERGRKRGQEGVSKRGKADAKSAAQDAAATVSPYQKARFAGLMVVVTCQSAAGRVIAPGLAMGQALANPKKENGHRCIVCGQDVIPGHVVVRVA